MRCRSRRSPSAPASRPARSIATFPSKTDLVAALVAAVSERELGAMRRAADAAPGPLSALAAALTTFAARALENRKLAFALIAEPVDADSHNARRDYRAAIARELESAARRRDDARQPSRAGPEDRGARADRRAVRGTDRPARRTRATMRPRCATRCRP